jgi:hypothetical protein
MNSALPELADDRHVAQLRDTLITLLVIMRPDWGGRQAIASRVQFAEGRLGRSLPQVCLQAVTAAVTPGTPPDAYIRSTPADTLRHLANPEHTAAIVAQLRRQLLNRPHQTAPRTADTLSTYEDPEALAADRAMLIQATAAHTGRTAWTRRDDSRYTDDVAHGSNGTAPEDRRTRGIPSEKKITVRWRRPERPPMTAGFAGAGADRALAAL